MFDKPSRNDRRSLLTLAVDNDRARHGRGKGRNTAKSDDNRGTFLRKKPVSVGQPRRSTKSVDIDAIERDSNRLGDDVRAAPSVAPHSTQPPRYPRPLAQHDRQSAPYEFSVEPLIDPIIIAQTMWRWRAGIVTMAITGSVLGAMIALSQPKEFTAYTQVLIDPREIRLVERDLTPEFLSNEGALAIIDSQLEFARSTAVLEKVIERTNLDQDPEFNGTADQGIGLLDGIDLLRSLFAEETPVDTNERVTIENLRDALDIDRASSTFVLSIGATSQSPRKAARLANEHAQAFIERQSTIEADTANSASAALRERLAGLQNDVATARGRLADFRATNNLFGETGDDIGVESVSALNATLINAKAETAAARARAQNAQGINVSAVVNGAVPSDLTTPSLTTFRAQYASLRQTAAGLEETLGPRHPRLAVARASVSAARQDIERELQRIIDAAQTDLERAIQAQNEIEIQLAQSNVALGQSNQLVGELRRLQAEVAASESIYQSALVRAREAGEIGALGSVNATVITAAEPPLSPSSTSRTVVTAGGGIAGFLLGSALAFIMGCANSFRARADAHARQDEMLRAATREPADPTPPKDRTKAPEPETKTTKASEPAMQYPGYPGYPVYAHAPQQPTMAGVSAQAMPGYPLQSYGAPVFAPAPQPHLAYPPQPTYPAYPPQAQQQPPQAVVVPQAQPVFVMAPPSQPPVSQPAPAAPQTATATSDPSDQELEELRQSVNDIREVLDHLVSARERRFG